MARRGKFKVASPDLGRDILHALDLAGEPLTPNDLAKRLRIARPERRSFDSALAQL